MVTVLYEIHIGSEAQHTRHNFINGDFFDQTVVLLTNDK